MVPEAADGYAVNLPPELAKYTGDASDPAMKALRDHAAAEKWPQGRFDEVMGLLKVFADKGVLTPMFDPAAERAKLGDRGEARQQEALAFATALKDRKEISDEEFGELASLAVTAPGVGLMEKLRKMMGPAGAQPIPPGPGDQSGESPAMDAAKALRADPKYGKDSRFTRAADKAWTEAFEASRAGR